MEENKILEIITAIGDSNLNDVLKLEKGGVQRIEKSNNSIR